MVLNPTAFAAPGVRALSFYLSSFTFHWPMTSELLRNDCTNNDVLQFDVKHGGLWASTPKGIQTSNRIKQPNI